MITNECVNSEREKSNLLCLIKLTLNTLIDQSSSPTAPTILDDRNSDVTNFILTLERVLNFRIRTNWLSERRFFWDFVRPACIGSARQTFIDRVEEVSKTRSLKEKGRTWIKFALMEKKLSELLKLILSDCQLVRKFYYDDSILISNQAFILCDQLAGLSALDFSFCFKQDTPILSPIMSNNLETDVIDLTPYLSYKSKHMKSYLQEQQNREENQESNVKLSSVNELQIFHEKEMIPLEKYKLEVEQRKYFEDLLRHRDRELQQIKTRLETMKIEKENESRLMENIIIELQLELRSAREDAEFKRRKSPQNSSTISPSRNLFKFSNRKANSPTTPTNDQMKDRTIDHNDNDNNDDDDDEEIDTQMRPIDATTLITTDKNDIQLSRRSSHSTTTTNTDDDQYEYARQVTTTNEQFTKDIKAISSPEMVSSATSLSSPSSSDEDEPIVHESGRFEPVEMTAEQANLLAEASLTT